jgi:cytochrome c-type biogenesis protein CcmF
MIPEIGHFALWLALGVALVLGVVPLAGAQSGRAEWMALARPLTVAQFALIATAYLTLTTAFVQNDFSVLYVASNSNSALPLPYRIAAVWGGHEGSLLLWMMMLCVWQLAVAKFSRHLPLPVLARILSVMGLVAVGFLAFTLITSNPFERLVPGAPDGRDLNPLLQDPGMVFHPPMLYMGYVGFSVAFAFAVAALIGGNLDTTWARWTRPWTTVAWIFLTLGIMLGSWWAYYELGWGGWWFWDPVENASFMPWLVGTALMHSLAVTEKRGSFRSWTVLLAILAFSLSLLGTFLVRSGVLSSVHAFATDPQRGLFILGFLLAVVGPSLALYAVRAGRLGLGTRFSFLSRETALLANNFMLLAACGAVLLGTLYPLLLDALTGQKLSVGPPYFEAVFVPLMLPVLVLLGVGPVLRWREAEAGPLLRALRWPLALAPLLALGHGWAEGTVGVMTALGLLMGWWVLATTAADLGARLVKSQALPRSVAAMLLAHAGVGVFVIGVTLVSSQQQELDTPLRAGEVAWGTAAGEDLVAAIDDEAQHLNRLVGNLLDMSRIEAGALKPQRQWNILAEIVDGVLAQMHRVSKQHRIAVEVPEDLPFVSVDYVQFEQVFTNLISNSLKYAPAGSMITIAALPQPDTLVRVTVANQGPPVPAEHLERIFDKFYRVSSADRVTGTGLGLSICKGIVEAHGGAIWAENVPGGFAFNFTLPTTQDGQASPALPADLEAQ